MEEKIKMWFEGMKKKVNWDNLYSSFQEAICSILLITGLILILLEMSVIKYDSPPLLPNLLIVALGCFGAYITLMNIFFQEP